MERSMLSLVAAFRADGFTSDFHSRPGGIVQCAHCNTSHRADALELHRLERLEGDSDPSEMLAVCAVACPTCGARGALVLTFGPESTREDDEVMELLDDVRH